MVTLPSKEELLALFADRGELFADHLNKRLQKLDWGISVKMQAEPMNNGEFMVKDSPALANAVANMTVKAGVEAVLAFIETISTTQVINISEEFQAINTRIGRLELVIANILPPTFQSPGSDTPINN